MRAKIIISDPNNISRFPIPTVDLKNPWRWVVPLAAALSLLALITLGDNVTLFYYLNRIMSHANNGLWTHFSLLGDGQFVLIFALPFLGRRPDIVWQYVLAFLAGGIFIQAFKYIFAELRPPAVLVEGSFHLIGPALERFAFPSGHTTTAFILAGLICLQRVPNWIKFVALLLAVFVGLSRIANGVHWPLDVLGGALGGWLVAIFVVWLSGCWRGGMKVGIQRIFALIFMPLSIWAIWSLWHHFDDVYPGTGVMMLSLFTICLVLSLPGLVKLFSFRK